MDDTRKQYFGLIAKGNVRSVLSPNTQLQKQTLQNDIDSFFSQPLTLENIQALQDLQKKQIDLRRNNAILSAMGFNSEQELRNYSNGL